MSDKSFLNSLAIGYAVGQAADLLLKEYMKTGPLMVGALHSPGSAQPQPQGAVMAAEPIKPRG